MAGFLYRFASYIMRGRRQAIVIGLLFTILPLLSWVSNVIVALVTLRQGLKEGAIVLLWIILPSVVVASLGNHWIVLYGIIGGSLFTYLLAFVLRHSQSWARVLEIGMLFGLLAVFLAHLWAPDISVLWLKELSHYAAILKTQLKLAVDTVQLQFFSRFATGFQVALLSLSALVNLVFARGLQSMLYNPKQLCPELERIRLPKWIIFSSLIVFLLSFQKIALAQDALPVLLLVFILAGLSVLHAIWRERNIAKVWVLIFYGLLIVFFPYLAALLVLLAVGDSIGNFRYHLQKKLS